MSLKSIQKNISQLESDYKDSSTTKWSKDELESLRILFEHGITSASFIFKKNLIEGRTYGGIRHQLHVLKQRSKSYE